MQVLTTQPNRLAGLAKCLNVRLQTNWFESRFCQGQSTFLSLSQSYKYLTILEQ